MANDQRLELATERHRAGDLLEARCLYRQVLAEAPADGLALFRLGLLELQDGGPQDALTLIDQAIATDPLALRYRLGRGAALRALQRWDDAAHTYRLVLAVDSRCADAHSSLGVTLESMGDDGHAIEAYEAATQVQPHLAEAHCNLGNCHRRGGDRARAERAYRRALTLSPRYADAMSNLGALLQESDRADEAIELLRTAVALEPAVARHVVNLGAALGRQGKFSEAAELLGRTLERDGTSPEAAFNLGNALYGLGRWREAADRYRLATQLRPDYVDAFNNLGNAYRELGEFKLALVAYRAAIQNRPDDVVALNNLACLLRTLGRTEEAEATLRCGLMLDASHAVLHANLGSVLMDAGDIDQAIACFRAALALNPANAATHSNLTYALGFQALEGQAILEECRRWNERHAAPLQAEIRGHCNDRSADRRLRIGYVSPDFRDHCQSLFTLPLLSHHDHAAFEIHCYSSVARPDPYTHRIAAHADVWRDVCSLDDAALGDVIRGDAIDVLVDLTMHMAHGRPLLFARKPAPVQVAWLAYPGTTGIGAMDYRLTDPRLDPPGCADQYSERSLWLPDSFWCYDPLADQPEVNSLPASGRGFVTFGCLNNPCKLTDQTLRLWGGVLRAIPRSRLLLMAPEGRHRGQMLERLARQGVAAERVGFVAHRPRADYLHSYHEIDLGLDTSPYNGHTTSLDAFWMGVPVITRIGPTCVGRGGLSQLFHLDLLELAAETDETFVQAAVSLAGDLVRLAALRQRLRSRLRQSALMDAERFARNIEACYRQGFRNYCETASR